MAVMQMVEKNIRPRDIVNERSLRNAIWPVIWRWAAPPIRYCTCWPSPKKPKVELDLNIINEVSQRNTEPVLQLAPAGPDHHTYDLYRAGGVQAVMKELQTKRTASTIR